MSIICPEKYKFKKKEKNVDNLGFFTKSPLFKSDLGSCNRVRAERRLTEGLSSMCESLGCQLQNPWPVSENK